MKSKTLKADHFIVKHLKELVLARVPLADGVAQWMLPMAEKEWSGPLRELAEKLRTGRSLGTAIRESSLQVSRPVAAMLDLLEHSADPAALLESIEKGIIEREKVASALREIFIYPAAILIIFSLVIVFYSFTMLETLYSQQWSSPKTVLLFAYSVLHPVRWAFLLLIPLTVVLVVRFMKDPLRLPLPGSQDVFRQSQRALLCELILLDFQIKRTAAETLSHACEVLGEPFDKTLENAKQNARLGLEVEGENNGLLSPMMAFVLNQSGNSEAAIESMTGLRDYYREQFKGSATVLIKFSEIGAIVLLGILTGALILEAFHTYYGYTVARFPY